MTWAGAVDRALVDANLFLDHIVATRHRLVASAVLYVRLYSASPDTNHEAHLKPEIKKFGVCWKCLIKVLKTIQADIRKLKICAGALKQIQSRPDLLPATDWSWLQHF